MKNEGDAAMVQHEYPWYIKAMAFFVMAWVSVQLVFQLWTFAQQNLIAQSQAAQQAQQMQQQLQKANADLAAERAKPKTEEKK